MPGVVKKFSATTTGVLAPSIPAARRPFENHGIQVKGVAVAATSWSVTLEGSLDGVNWTVLATHAATDGSTQWTTGKPVMWLRANVGALTLGSASSISIFVTASSSNDD